MEDGIRRISLRKDGLPGRQPNDSSPQSGARQKCLSIKCGFFQLYHRSVQKMAGQDYCAECRKAKEDKSQDGVDEAKEVWADAVRDETYGDG
jgi:hypothetical protein